MKHKLIATIFGLLLVPLLAHAQVTSNFWKVLSAVLQPSISTWQLYSPSDFRFDGDILPDGALCAVGDILKKAGVSDWDCVPDSGTTGKSKWATTTDASIISPAGATGIIVPRATTTSATTTNLAITALTSELLKVDGTGVVREATAGADYEVPVTAGDGLTRTVNDFDCDTASGAVFGCLTAVDWTTFNDKLGFYDAWTHPSAGISATTSSLLVNSATSTITNLTTVRATSTNATTTSNHSFASGIWKSTGVVGINTTNPSAQLHISFTTDDGQALKIGEPSASQIDAIYLPKGADAARNWLTFNQGATALSDWRVGMVDSTTSYGLSFFNSANSAGTPSSPGLEVLRMTGYTNAGHVYVPSGKFGVGTTSAYAKLTIANHNGGQQPLFVIASSSPAVSTSTYMLVGPTGNVGIGTAAPTAKLNILTDNGIIVQNGWTNSTVRPAVAGGTNQYELRAANNNPIADDGFLRISAGGGTAAGAKAYIDISGYSTLPDLLENIVFGTAGTEKMRILNTGFVGIGTSTPDVRFNVYTSATDIASFDSENASFARITVDGRTNTTDSYLSFMQLGSTLWSIGQDDSNANALSFSNSSVLGTNERMTLSTAGNFGLGTTSPFAKFSIHQFANATFNKYLFAVASSTSAATTTLFAIDNTGQVTNNGNVIPEFYYSTFTYSTSTAWTGTTTVALGPAYRAETWNGVKCFTNAGTVNVSVYDGTNRMDLLQASTTVGTFGFATNNSFTSSEKRYVDLGTPATSPTSVSCTVSKYYTP